MRELPGTLYEPTLPAKMPRPPARVRLQRQRWLKKRQREKAPPVGDRHLEDRALALPHSALLHRADLGDDRHRLVDVQLVERGQLSPAGVAARVVREQLARRAVTEGLLDRLLARAQDRAEPAVEQ
ncbi:MAG: hypothetical protein R2717_09885 [Schumannella sp.]